jgi:hypothetical protein
LLALLFAFAGVMKLVMPADALAQQSGMNVTFLRFIGVCETLGALGLILPGVFRLYQQLTGLAAAGLVVIMIGATVLTTMQEGALSAIFPFVVGCLATVIATQRWSAQPTRTGRTQLAAGLVSQ